MSNCVLPLVNNLGRCVYCCLHLYATKDVYYFKHVKDWGLSMDSYISTCSYASFGGVNKTWFWGVNKNWFSYLPHFTLCCKFCGVNKKLVLLLAPLYIVCHNMGTCTLDFKISDSSYASPCNISKWKPNTGHVGSRATTLQHTQSCLKQQCSVCTHGGVLYYCVCYSFVCWCCCCCLPLCHVPLQNFTVTANLTNVLTKRGGGGVAPGVIGIVLILLWVCFTASYRAYTHGKTCRGCGAVYHEYCQQVYMKNF